MAKHIQKKCTRNKQSFYFMVFHYCVQLGIISVAFVLAQRITITLQLNRFVVVLFCRFPYVSLSRYPSNEILFRKKLFIYGCAGCSCYVWALFSCEELFIAQHDSVAPRL